jgi:probable F420-dependent oxidoreductase
VLGLGVSHPHLVTRLRGHAWEKPVPKMRSYLEAVSGALYRGPEPEVEAPIVIAALRPKMMELARDRARGAHPYLTTPEHTRRARGILGKGPWLCPEQMLILDTDAANARKVARANLEVYLRAPNYQESLKELGFGEEDFGGGGSDRLVDALVGWGDEKALRARIQAHWDAGADHVCIQPYRPDGKPGVDLRALEALAPNA